ncbi:pyridoxamine 5'-phosphate oxidase family protein [Gracilibacillus sp. YIM 98692]|uniref:pyridoxamine 5'-phosphate oxidase family protein n=1 Tax=Gracilibacillus sp. YIM 98692 TaxID=2663532 RepID=UPI0013D5C37E|nr:pyridoxamine 5'-phosphate oxidase family protein [Gracilibacillus sp. YIM 98692]
MSRGERLLQEKYGTGKRAASFYRNQMLNFLNQQMRSFIAEQTMMFIATADANGNCDSSFRAGLPGFAVVLDEYTLMYPEYRGNGVMASLGNISENPHIGIMFIDFIEQQIGLHVNGQASIVEHDDLQLLKNITSSLLEEIEEREGNKPERWVQVKVEEAYIHCSKHIPKLKPVEKMMDWGTDDEKKKGGDFFHAKREQVKKARKV